MAANRNSIINTKSVKLISFSINIKWPGEMSDCQWKNVSMACASIQADLFLKSLHC